MSGGLGGVLIVLPVSPTAPLLSLRWSRLESPTDVSGYRRDTTVNQLRNKSRDQ